MALEYKPLNLGQGFPDYPPPDYVTKGLVDVLTDSNCLLNQYTRGFVSLTTFFGRKPFIAVISIKLM